MKFEELRTGARVIGLSGGHDAEIVEAKPFGPDALNIVYRAGGSIGERLVYRGDEEAFDLASAGRTYAFDGDGAAFRLAAEAQRIRLAHLFDPFLAVTASDIEALPHQITAVYGEMLTRHPLRFLLADDPGAGKTVMAGLLIKELLIRGDLERCLVIAPGSLVEQWQEEMAEKFGLRFDLLTRDRIESSLTGNPFAEGNRIIMRLDMAARSEEIKAKLEAAPEWDLVIVDEAHRMSASLFGNEVKETQRHKLGKLVGSLTRNFLLMSATPHNGKEADFQLFMGLLDADRFEGRPRQGVHKADVSDMMRRLTKEELYRFDGTKLFPERIARTAGYELSPEEAALYGAVTTYVREEMNRADMTGDDKKRSNVGFALQVLQRRLASSPAAIHRSLERRRKRLEERLHEEKMIASGKRRRSPTLEALDAFDEDEYDEAGGEEAEAYEDSFVDNGSNAETITELEAELVSLRALEIQALAVKRSGRDAKWTQLKELLDAPEMHDPETGTRRKLLIFTEPKDTLNDLVAKIGAYTGEPDSVVTIHGGVAREARRAAIAAFNSDPDVRFMIANDAAGEGVNLQRGAHLMVNYDLPWNPNKLEQRFGRIHRIGQTMTCHLWNLVAVNTREGAVYERLLEKLEAARDALGDKVYDVLGELFEGRALKDLLMDAVRYGDAPETREAQFRKVEGAVDVEEIRRIVKERKLTSEGMDPGAITAIREEMERAEARRLQPHFIGSFFGEAFKRLGGRMSPRETGRFEITRTPSILKQRDRLIGRADPVLDRYARITFEKEHMAGQPQAELVAPGHPLLDATVDLVLERQGMALRQGAILIDDADDGTVPRLLFMLEHGVRDGRMNGAEPRVISQRLQFVLLDEEGRAVDGGVAPHLDLRPAEAEELAGVRHLVDADWLTAGVEERALGHAIAHLVPAHLSEVRARRLQELDRVAAAVEYRLGTEITYWDGRAARLREEERAGKQQRLNAQNADATAAKLVERLDTRRAELALERQISALKPVLRGAALVVPRGLLASMEEEVRADAFAEDPDARAEIERIAMAEVMGFERQAGRLPEDVSMHNRGWDIESRDPESGALRFIEVKGRRADARTVTVTRNEILQSLNVPDRYWLAVVLVEKGFARPPVWIRRFAERQPGFAEVNTSFDLAKLLAMSEASG